MMGYLAAPKLPTSELVAYIKACGGPQDKRGMAEWCEINERTFWRWIEKGGIPLTSADTVAENLGCHPTDIWGREYSDAEMPKGGRGTGELSEAARRSLHSELGNIKESSFQRLVIKFAKEHGWLVHHEYDSRFSDPGFPDLVLIRGDYLLLAELKSEAGRLTDAQEQWRDLLLANGVEYHIWRPSDWEEVQKELSR